MNAIHNERVKLAASALNKTGVAIIIVGVVMAVATSREAAPSGATLFPTALALVLVGFALLALARLMLGRLKGV